jgi:hypothetical protein
MEIPVFSSAVFLKKPAYCRGREKSRPGIRNQTAGRGRWPCTSSSGTSALLSGGNEYGAGAGTGKKGCLYEANPMVNCDEPEVVFGTSLAYTV